MKADNKVEIKDNSKDEENAVAVPGVPVAMGGTLGRIVDRAKKFVKDYSLTIATAAITTAAAIGGFASAAHATNSEDRTNRAAVGGIVAVLGSVALRKVSSWERNNKSTAQYKDYMGK